MHIKIRKHTQVLFSWSWPRLMVQSTRKNTCAFINIYLIFFLSVPLLSLSMLSLVFMVSQHEWKMQYCRVKWNRKKTVYVVWQTEWTAVFTDDDVSTSKIKKKLSSVSYRINLFHIGLIIQGKIHNVVCFYFLPWPVLIAYF